MYREADMYTVILVDDEGEIREGIINKIKWNDLGFEVVGSAENGKETLELVEKLNPDVVMTDIMMPFMDGLELGEELAEKYPLTKIIIFSGFDDLEYAHKAIKLNVVEYILKPVNSNDMTETLIKLKKQLDDEYESKTNLETLREHYIASMPVIKEQLIVSLIEGRSSIKELLANKDLIGIDTDKPYHVLGLLQVDAALSENREGIFNDHGEALMTATLKQLSTDIMDRYHLAHSFIYGNMVGFIFDLNAKDEIYKIINGMNEICAESKKIYGLSVSGGLSNIIDYILNMDTARKEAISALEYRVAVGNEKTIYFHDVEPDNSVKIRFSDVDESKLTSAIRIGNIDEITEIVDNIINKLSDTVLALDQYKIYFMEIKIALLHLIQTYGVKNDATLTELEKGIDILEAPASIESFRKWLLDKSTCICECIKKERVNSASLLIDKAKEYVEANYSDCDLSVENLSNELHVSPTYFSTIFKRETGSNFIAYLTDIRLEKAIKFLNTTDDKSYIIAEKVGYSEPNYFSYVFKKKYGVSPSKYRKR